MGKGWSAGTNDVTCRHSNLGWERGSGNKEEGGVRSAGCAGET
jgi:hypothetical protein